MITVFGSINLDLVFRTSRLPHEGETILTDGFTTVPGGKGANQAVAAARAQAPGTIPVRMAGCIGEDAFADLALQGMRASGVDMALIGRTRRPTGCASITVDDLGRNQITVASGANLDASQGSIGDDLLRSGDWVILQNEVAERENLALARRAAERRASTILNAAPARPMDAAKWEGLLRVLVVNEPEAEAIAGSSDRRALHDLSQRLRSTVVATLGARGAMAVEPDGASMLIGALPLARVVDTTAAGDCFVGALACALQEGQSLPDALRFASVAGGLACTKAGAQTSAPARAEILKRLDDLDPARPVAD